MSDRSIFRLSSLSLVAASAVTVASLAISGCATGIIADPNPVAASAVTLQGTAFGGSTPITSGTVSVWETDPASSGYPTSASGAKVLATTTTGDGSTTINGTVPAPGAWSITSSYSCDAAATNTAGPFLYVTVVGGNTGAGVNNQSVLIAPLGACAAVLANKSSLHVTVNESSTIATAYALGPFIYVDNTTPGSQGVYIGSTATNNAKTGSCTGTGAAMTCVAAGLSHAFANAFNLGAFVNLGSQAIGQAQPTIQANPITGTAANPNASVPVAQLNTLSNIIATCVNSTGSTGTTCPALFALATNAAGTVPVDTLTAAINIAQNPSHNVGSATANGLFQLANSTGPYQPALTTYPHDWSVGIFYTGTGGYSFGQPQGVALDANDNVYISAIAATSTNPTAGSVSALTSNGSAIWTTGNNATIAAPQQVATDTAGNVWVSNFETSTFGSTGTPGIYGFPQASSGSTVAPTFSFNNASTENVQGATWGLATDRGNNLWYGRKQSSCNTTAGTGANTSPLCVAEIPYNGGSYGAATNLQTWVSGTNIQGTPLTNNIAIVLDANQNVWAASYESASNVALGVITNSGTVAAPAYANGGSTPVAGSQSFGMLAIDASGNAWTGVANALQYFSLSGATVSAANSPSLGSGSITATKPQGAEFDGNGKLYFPSETSSGQIWFFNPANATAGDTGTTVASGMVPCYLPNGTATCTVGSQYIRTLQIDSTGAVWAAAPFLSIATANATSVGTVVQLFGGAPTWPQLSYAKFGVKP